MPTATTVPAKPKVKNDQPRVHIFWDDSNIFLEGRKYAERNEGSAYAPLQVHMLRAALDTDKPEVAVLLGGLRPEQPLDLKKRSKALPLPPKRSKP